MVLRAAVPVALAFAQETAQGADRDGLSLGGRN